MGVQTLKLIPPKSKRIIEFYGSDVENYVSAKDDFMRINPACNYIVSSNFDVKVSNVDTVVFDSSAFAVLSLSKLTEIINKVSKKLCDDGLMIFELENIGCVTNIAAILNDRSPTVKATMSIKDLQKAINDSVMTVTNTMNLRRAFNISPVLKNVAKTDLETTHFAVRAIKKSVAEKFKQTVIQCHLGEVLVCAGVRLNDPNQFIATRPNIYITNRSPQKGFSVANNPKLTRRIFINQRISFNNIEMGEQIYNILNQNRYLFVSEMDDHPILWKDKYIENQFINFIICHGIQTSTKMLGEFFKQFNPHVMVFENHLTQLLPLRNFAAERAQNKPVTIFFGALNRDRDTEELLPVINKIAAEYGDKIAFKIISRQELFDKFDTPYKTYIGDKTKYDGQFVSYDVYQNALRTSDISLLPLQNNIFNRGKSDLKFIESAGNGAVALASPTVYSDTIKEGETGLIYHNMDEFYNKLKTLIDNSDLRYKIAKNAYNYVKHNRMLYQHYEERINWYIEMYDRLPELNNEVQERLAILKEKGASAFGGF